MIGLLMIPLASIGIVLGGKFGGSRIQDSSTALDLDDDLPCPWCFAPTNEHDTACPSCGRRFGMANAGGLDSADS